MLNRLSLRARIFLFLIPALLYMGGVTGVLIYQGYKTQIAAGELKLSEQYFGALSGFIHAVQKERGLSDGVLTGKIPRSELTTHREIVSQKVRSIETQLQQMPAEWVAVTKESLKQHAAIQVFVDDNGHPVAATKRFSDLIETMIGYQASRARQYPLGGHENELVSLAIFEMAKENAGRLRAYLTGILGQDKPVDVEELTKIQSYKSGVINNMHSQGINVSEKAQKAVEELFESPDWRFLEKTVEVVHSRATVGSFGVDPQEYFKTVTRVIDGLALVINAEAEVIGKEVDRAKSEAQASFWFYALIGISGVIGTALMIWKMTYDVVSTLTGVVTDLTQSVQVVSESSKELSDSANGLSSGVTEQAAALQETVSSLEEVRSMVGKNAEGARYAKTLAAKSSDEVQRGQDSVEQLLLAVQDIHHSNEAIEKQVESSNQELSSITRVIAEIGEKTKVINDIVFQTKLLSFNASVEAARAGEYGKGFAVVAEEVGNLAEMSGKAAKEIVDLLESSTQQVDDIVRNTKTKVGGLISEGKHKIDSGVATAKTCKEAFSAIATSAEDLGQVISEVAIASDEQAKGVDEITKAMNQLDEVTQNNSSAANQAAGVASLMSSQTETINELSVKLDELVYGHGDNRSRRGESGGPSGSVPAAPQGESEQMPMLAAS